MNKLLKQVTAILLLAIYAVNPLHAVLHAGHKHNSHGDCTSSSCKSGKTILNGQVPEESHECFLCQNNQDRTYLLPAKDKAESRNSFTVTFCQTLCKSEIIDNSYLIIDSRGPPLFI